MRVDLYTDAGVKNGVATWATVAIIPGLPTPIEASGRLRAETRCSATAECRAIANALHKMIRAGHLERGSSVRIITDSKHAADRIAGRLTRRPESPMARAVLVIHKAAEVHGIVISTLWVRGHRPDSADQHAPHNNRCDALCRAARALPPPKVPTKAGKALAQAKRLAGKGA